MNMDASAEVRDPTTNPARLAELAVSRPDLQAQIAAHPRVYPELQAWIAQNGTPEARAAARSLLTAAQTPPSDSRPSSAPTPSVPAASVSSEPASAAAPVPSGVVPVSRRARITAWSVAGAVTVLALAVAVPVSARVITDNTAAGSLADGTSWGVNLGAEVQRNDELALSSGGTEQSLAVSWTTGTAYVPTWDALYSASTDDLAQVQQAPMESTQGSPAIAISADGGQIFLTSGSGGDAVGELEALSADGMTVTQEYFTGLPGDGSSPEQAAVSMDGSRLFVADMNTGFWVLSTQDGSAIDNPVSGMSTVVAVNPADGTVAVNSAMEDAVILTDATGTNEIGRIQSESGLPDALAFSPDGALLAIGEGGVVRFYDATGAVQGTLDLSTDDTRIDITDLAFSPDSGELAVLTSEDEGTDSDVRLIDVASASQLTRIPLTDWYILGDIAFSGVPGQLLALSDGGLVRIDIGASRTNWAGLTALLAVLAVLMLGAIAAAATISRWRPAMVAAQERARREGERERQAEAARTAELLAQQHAAAEATEQARLAAEHAERVRQVQQWQDAYREANPGQDPPDGFLPMTVPAAAAPARVGTNVMAILSIIFGIGGGLLGIVFGHIALSQIKRTGESGRGLAITGLVLGYLGIAVVVISAVVLLYIMGGI